MTQPDKSLSRFLKPAEFKELDLCLKNQRPYLLTGNRSRISKYFSMKDFEALVNQTGVWMPDRLQVFLDSQQVPPQKLFEQLPLQKGTRYRVDNDTLRELIKRGASVVLNDIDSMTAGLKSLRNSISGYTGGRVESNLYFSQPNHQAFTVHFDVHDVFAFQIAGEKRWKIYQQRHQYPINHPAFLSGDVAMHEREKGAVTMDFTMQQGDFLYIPAGYYHQALCTEQSSVHLSYSSVEMIGLDVVSELFDAAVAHEAFRAPAGRTLENGNRPVADYLAMLSGVIGEMMRDEAFVTKMEEKMRGFSYVADDVSLKIDKKMGGAKRAPHSST